MRPWLFAAILFSTSAIALAGPLAGGGDAPQMTDISQKTAKPGDVITVSGLGLSTTNVDEVYLTDHKFDMRVKVLEQTDTAVKFRVPPFAKPGRMQMLFLSKGNEPKLLEQPVYLLIEDSDAAIVATAKPAPEPAKTEAAAPAKTQDKTEEKTETPAPKTEAAKETKSDPAKEIHQPTPHNN